ncbi:MAG TPA: hypothetical protein VFZ97_06715 [Acidimicrobiales bacterium]
MNEQLTHLSEAVQYLADQLPAESADGLFCRRLVALGIGSWSEAVTREAARTVYEHGDEILDIDVGDLDICAHPLFWPKDFAARIEARHKSAPAMVEVVGRRVDLLDGGTLRFVWHVRDPDHPHIEGDCFNLPGVRATPAPNLCKVVLAPSTPEAADFARSWDFIATPTARTVIRKARSQSSYLVKLGPPGWVLIHGAVPQHLLPVGWQRYQRHYRAPLQPETVSHCRSWRLPIDPAVDEALVEDTTTESDSEALRVASSCARPEALPERFLTILRQRLAGNSA